MINFCWGEVLAKTISVWYIKISSSAFSDSSLISPPWTTAARASLGLTSLMSQPCVGDVLHGLLALRDDAHRPGDRLGGDGVVASHHDDLDSSRPALGHGVRHSSPGRIDHGHQADEAEAVEGEVLLVRVEGVADGVLVGGQ